MREADVAIRLRQPTQPDLIQRKLFSVHFHAYASPEYLKRFGTPRTLEELDNHRIIAARRHDGAGLPAKPQLADRGRPQRQRPARSRASSSTTSGRAARLPARPRHRAAAGLSGRGERRPGAAVRRRRRTSRSMRISSIRKSSNRWRACRCSAISWSATRSAGVSDRADICRSMLSKIELRRHCFACACACCSIAFASAAWLACGALHCLRTRERRIISLCCRRWVVASSQISQPSCRQLFPSGR